MQTKLKAFICCYKSLHFPHYIHHLHFHQNNNHIAKEELHTSGFAEERQKKMRRRMKMLARNEDDLNTNGNKKQIYEYAIKKN